MQSLQARSIVVGHSHHKVVVEVDHRMVVAVAVVGHKVNKHHVVEVVVADCMGCL